MRRSGRITRIIEEAIKELLSHGVVTFSDHDGYHHSEAMNREIFRKMEKDLKVNHGVKPDGLYTKIMSKSIYVRNLNYKAVKQQKSNWLYNQIVGNFMSWFIAVTIMSFYVNEWTQSPWIMVIGLFVGSFWTVNLHAYYEAYRIEVEKKEIDHEQRFLVRALVAICISIAVSLLAFGIHKNAWELIFGTIYLGAIFWLLFDFMLNYHREKEILYVSSYYRTSKLDKFFSRFNDNTRILLWVGSKIVVFVLAAWAYYKVI